MNELTQLGRYRLLRVLGRGAMGMVYEGVDPKLNRRVAIKVISTDRIDAALRADYSARFIAEAQAVARMNHPNIVTVYDFGEENGIAYLVMELIEGEELSGYFDESQAFQLDFTLEDTVRMTGELLDAVGYAHQQGIVHRDIKPANVMLSSQLRVKLTDFGVARLYDKAAQDAATGELVGTPSYMSPEQIAGQPAGPRADIFAVGIILYQFLTGEKPFRGPNLFSLQQAILHGQPPLASSVNPFVSPMFDRVVLRALARRPEDRYPDAQAFKADLVRALHGETVRLDDTMPPQARLDNAFLHAADPAPSFTPAPVSAPAAAPADDDATVVAGAIPPDWQAR